MQKLLAFFLVLSAMFLGFFYDYDDSRLIDKMNPGIEQSQITSDKISIEIENEMTMRDGELMIKIVNHTGKYYQFGAEPDIEVLTKDGWYDVVKSAFLHIGEIKGYVDANQTITVKAKNINIYNIKKGYTYRLVMQFDDTEGEIVTAEARFNVAK